jgi:phosphatidylserine/phosphatidylglycerophosphate/cardiolipin synthase-like enzyme
VAFVGSSNLTDPGLISNQEINIAIDDENPAFEILEEIFSEYWEQATPLTRDVLEKYVTITSTVSSEIDKLNRQAQKEIETRIGKVEFSNIKRGNNDKQAKSKLISDTLLKRYQMCILTRFWAWSCRIFSYRSDPGGTSLRSWKSERGTNV